MPYNLNQAMKAQATLRYAAASLLALVIIACVSEPILRRAWVDSRLAGAVKQGDCHKASDALSAGADPNIVPTGNYPVLTQAVLQGDLCMVSTLLRHGADVDVPDAWGGTPLAAAVSAYYDQSPSGCSGNADSAGGPNSGCRCYEMVKFLIVHGADVSAKFALTGKTVLQSARFEHDRTHPPNAQPPLPPWKDEMVPLLQQRGAK